MNKTRHKFYITAYALTSGIRVDECKEPDSDGYLFDGVQVFGKDEWAFTWEEAKAKAEAMRAKKLASLKKQIAKLEAMTFEEPKEAPQ